MKKRMVHIAMLTMIVSLCLSAFCGKDALAKKRIPIPMLINIGDVIYPVAPIPDAVAARSDAPDILDWKLGYRCQHFGIFYADIVCWDKELVIFKENTYSEIPGDLRGDLEAEYPFSEADRTTWNRYGLVIVISILIALGALGALGQKLTEKDRRRKRDEELDRIRQSAPPPPPRAPVDAFSGGDDGTKCPKCRSERGPGDDECPNCGIIYEKYLKIMARRARHA